MTSPADDPLAGYEVDPRWDRDPASHPELDPWRRLASEWTPESSLERIDNKAAFVFGNVALVGTLAAGLGLATLAKVPPRLQPVAVVAGALLVLALALALAATLPSWRSTLTLDPMLLKRSYERRISLRGRLVRLSLLAYAGAFVAAIVLAALALTASRTPSLGLTKTAKGSGQVVVGSVAAQDLASDSELMTTLAAVDATGSPEVLATDLSRPGSSDAFTLTLTADPAPQAASYRLTFVVKDAAGVSVTQTLELPG